MSSLNPDLVVFRDNTSISGSSEISSSRRSASRSTKSSNESVRQKNLRSKKSPREKSNVDKGRTKQVVHNSVRTDQENL